MREFINLNISRSILIDLVKNVYEDASQESKELFYSVILVITVLQMVYEIENTVS